MPSALLPGDGSRHQQKRVPMLSQSKGCGGRSQDGGAVLGTAGMCPWAGHSPPWCSFPICVTGHSPRWGADACTVSLGPCRCQHGETDWAARAASSSVSAAPRSAPSLGPAHFCKSRPSRQPPIGPWPLAPGSRMCPRAGCPCGMGCLPGLTSPYLALQIWKASSTSCKLAALGEAGVAVQFACVVPLGGGGGANIQGTSWQLLAGGESSEVC